MRALPIAFVCALAGCATAAKTPPANETLRLETTTWGRPIFAWELRPDGSGTYTTASEHIPDQNFFHYKLTTRSFNAGPSGYAEVRALLEPARAFVRGKIKCEPYVADAPRGSVHWISAGQDLVGGFDTGCMAKPFAKTLNSVWAANEKVVRWGEAGKIKDETTFEPPSR